MPLIAYKLIFFGAGASKPFGIPTMQEMVNEFETKLKKHTDEFRFYHKIKDALAKKNTGSQIDIESMLSVINGIASETRQGSFDDFVFYYIRSNCPGSNPDVGFSSGDVDLAKKLRKKLHEYVKDVCKIQMPREKMQDAYKNSYLPLFKHMPSEAKQKHGDVDLATRWKAYTTNYDDVFERFWNGLQRPTDHFKRIGESDMYRFDNGDLRDKDMTFAKLHGSLNWTKQENDGSIVRNESDGFELYGTGDIMLFPIQHKDLYLHPWFTLFGDLKHGLAGSNMLYAIGYAFNDEFIINAFVESLESDDSKSLMVIDPDAGQIRVKFPEHVQNQINILPISFGDEFFGMQFQDHASGVKTLVIRFLITRWSAENRITIQSSRSLRSARILNEDAHGFKVNPNTSQDGKISDPDQTDIRLQADNPPTNVEIKLELQIAYRHGEKIELRFSDNTRTLDFGIDYGGMEVFSSNQIRKEYEEVDDMAWLKDSITLDKTQLYR